MGEKLGMIGLGKMGLAIELAEENGIELKVVKAAREMFKRAYDAGWGKDDATRVIEVYEGKDKQPER
jgi:hypothetical protein